MFSRQQREQADGSKVPRSLSHRIYSSTVSLHGVGNGERLETVRQTFCFCILRMLFSSGLMRVEFVGLEYPPFWQHGFRIR
jgi:hypothetical protein